MIARDLLVGTVWLRDNRCGFIVLEYSSKQLVSATVIDMCQRQKKQTRVTVIEIILSRRDRHCQRS